MLLSIKRFLKTEFNVPLADVFNRAGPTPKRFSNIRVSPSTSISIGVEPDEFSRSIR
jgi:hypothetical protein